MARATSSLPVPDSPSSSAVVDVGATRRTISSIRLNGNEWPTSWSRVFWIASNGSHRMISR